MAWRIEKAFDAPVRGPNGIQGTDEGLWIVDRVTDFAFLLTEEGDLVRCIPTWSEVSSGITHGGGALWVSDNGPTTFRPPRPTDRRQAGVLKIDPADGAKLAEFDLPGSQPGQGGTHGLEWAEGTLWIQMLRSQTLAQVNPEDFAIQHTIPLLHSRAHGMVWRNGHLWCIYTNDRIIVQQDPLDGHAVDAIPVPAPHPEPHGLTWWRGSFWYCSDPLHGGSTDAGAVCRIYP
jgi:hypothetical protein